MEFYQLRSYELVIEDARKLREKALGEGDYELAIAHRARQTRLMREEAALAAIIREVGDKMFERFTDRARRVVVLAQEESRMLKHNHIGSEHLLLALIHE